MRNQRQDNNNKNDNDGSSGPGMEDAFRQLENLSSIDNSDPSSGTGFDKTLLQQKKKQKKDEAFAKAMEKLDLKDILETSSTPEVSPESEAELYKDMVSELSSVKSEDELIADLKNDLIGEDGEMLSTSIDTNDEEFMNQAINEALKEAKEQNSDLAMDKESLLDNKEIMSEIEKIFDKANEQLLQGLEEIRSEQVRCVCVFTLCLYNLT